MHDRKTSPLTIELFQLWDSDWTWPVNEPQPETNVSIKHSWSPGVKAYHRIDLPLLLRKLKLYYVNRLLQQLNQALAVQKRVLQATCRNNPKIAWSRVTASATREKISTIDVKVGDYLSSLTTQRSRGIRCSHTNAWYWEISYMHMRQQDCW